MTPPVELCFGCMEARDPSGICPHCGYQTGTAPTSSLYLKPGSLLQDQYVVGRVLGHGGFGITYLGFDSVLQRKIAIKEYLPSSLASRHTENAQLSVHYEQLRTDFDFGLQRFLEEARTLARFHGLPNIIWVMNFFAANGTAYMVMEYLEGETFESYLARNGGRVSFAAAKTILIPVMDALREVHRQAFLHRDISPDNIFLVNNGPVKLLDFGAARYAMSMRSQGLSVIVKQGYAPEEQYTALGEQGPWTDVYALGGTMYRAITGHLPTNALERRMSGELTLPSLLGSDIPPACELVLMKALSMDVAERYHSVEEFQAALETTTRAVGFTSVRPAEMETQMLSHSQLLVTPPTTPFTRPASLPVSVPDDPPGQTRSRAPLVLGIVALLLLGLGYTAFRAITKPPDQTPQIKTFSARDASVATGMTTILTWEVTHAANVAISPALGQVASSGIAEVTPHGTTTYRLTATGKNGKSVERTLEVIVSAAAPAAPTDASKKEPFPAQPEPVGTPPPAAPHVSPPLLPAPVAATPLTALTANQFRVAHLHNNGTPPGMGILSIQAGHVVYKSSAGDQPSDDFDRSLTDIAEARKNHRFHPGSQAFHIKFNDGRNYNFDPKSGSAAQILKTLAQ
jgi:serine/threonine protein kinase